MLWSIVICICTYSVHIIIIISLVVILALMFNCCSVYLHLSWVLCKQSISTLQQWLKEVPAAAVIPCYDQSWDSYCLFVYRLHPVSTIWSLLGHLCHRLYLGRDLSLYIATEVLPQWASHHWWTPFKKNEEQSTTRANHLFNYLIGRTLDVRVSRLYASECNRMQHSFVRSYCEPALTYASVKMWDMIICKIYSSISIGVTKSYELQDGCYETYQSV